MHTHIEATQPATPSMHASLHCTQPSPVQSLMVRCLNPDHTRRPSFEEVAGVLCTLASDHSELLTDTDRTVVVA